MVLKPNIKKQIAVWIFLFLVALTRFIEIKLWMLSAYQPLLYGAMIISIAVAIWILVQNHFNWRAVVLVIIGLLFGQWWIIEELTAMFLWSINGFAP